MPTTQWGRKETIIWPPHSPIYTYGAIFFHRCGGAVRLPALQLCADAARAVLSSVLSREPEWPG